MQIDNLATAPKVRTDLSVVAPDQVAANLERYAELSRGAFSKNTIRAVKADTSLFSDWCADTATV